MQLVTWIPCGILLHSGAGGGVPVIISSVAMVFDGLSGQFCSRQTLLKSLNAQICLSVPSLGRLSRLRSARRPQRLTLAGSARCEHGSHSVCTCYEPSDLDRRALLWSTCGALAALTLRGRQAVAAQPIPPGSRRHVDKLDGYSFLIPQDWTPVTSSGNDIFFRNPFNVNENLFVGLSSPSSRKYDSLDALGSPEKAAEQTLKQYLDELGSTRLGVRREGEIVSASSRSGADGRQYYDIQVRVKSYASRNQLAVYQRKVESGMQLEWDRRYITVLGAANQRLYQLRLQTANSQFDKSKDTLINIAESFQCNEVQKA